MQIPPFKPEKAYKDREFLSSRDTRMIRILSEYAQPQQRFEEEAVENTVVFFGSARIKDLEEAVGASWSRPGKKGTILRSAKPSEASKSLDTTMTA